IPACASPQDVGCIMAWSTFEEGVEITRFDGRAPVFYASGFESIAGKPLVCTNPLDGGANSGKVDASQHLGGIEVDDGGAITVSDVRIAAGCVGGVLRIERPSARVFRVGAVRGDYHLGEYPLLWMNIRADANTRVAAFVATP